MAVLQDASPRSIVVFCTECPWREIVTSATAADRAGRDHANGAHPGDPSARAALNKRRQRERVSLR